MVVLLTRKSMEEFINANGDSSVGSSFAWEPSCVKALTDFVAKKNAKIVVSSTWRTSPRRMAVIKEILGDVVIGQTPDSKDSHRGREIEEYLQTFPFDQEFIIIDDDSFDILDTFPKEIFVHTKFETGLTPELLKEHL